MTKLWRALSLDQVADVIGRGITPKYDDYGDLLVINQKCIRDGRISLDKARRHDSASRMVRADKKLIAGDVLVNSTGVGTLGRTARLREVDLPMTADSHVTILRPLDGVSSAWLGYAVSHKEPEIEALAEGSTGQTELSRHRLAALKLAVPPFSEQQAIAATLGALDDKLESNRRLISLSEELSRTIFARMFDLTQSESGVALSDLVSVNARRVLRSGTPATYVGMSSLPEFSAEVYDWEKKEAGSGQRFVSGDVLMARITPCLENGKTAVVDMLEPGEVGWGSTEYVVLSPAGLISTPWIYCLVRDERVREFAIQSMTGTSGRQRFQADRLS
ncbi:restriction endonuclease subunit S [uncultured Microbacterium sp.]|uniref:restriction endonuclease subunit S n=1 Tax=uncultured Microbacterium sp. TaxID=191216 RepID=UPI0025E91AAA|nr:restriction endonuclease subunit S [uncultured Microbacterium sp.]